MNLFDMMGIAAKIPYELMLNIQSDLPKIQRLVELEKQAEPHVNALSPIAQEAEKIWNALSPDVMQLIKDLKS